MGLLFEASTFAMPDRRAVLDRRGGVSGRRQRAYVRWPGSTATPARTQPLLGDPRAGTSAGAVLTRLPILVLRARVPVTRGSEGL
jgi:hypothetical protein